LTNWIASKVEEAGVVGAGGAGFPTHVKLQASVETYIANAAECEPLLCKDQEMMVEHADEMVRGLRACMEATGSQRGVIAIKKKYQRAIDMLERSTGDDIDFYLYDNFYPAGDEYIIVYDVMGRLIPPGGIPLDVGCAVNNVETLINVARALDDQPVTTSSLTVTGAVARPVTVTVPLGTRMRDVLELAGGPTVSNPAVLDGGAMMGSVALDLDKRVTKTTGGYIVLPRNHSLITRKTAPEDVKVHISRSACDQCMYCTEFCPRFLLGYAIEPHKVMRSVGFEGEREAGWAQLGLQCCECSICDLYACPEDLPPKDMCVRSKSIWRQSSTRVDPLPHRGEVHPMRDSRRIPVSRLTQRLGLAEYDVHAPFTSATLDPDEVQLLLRQHVGAPAEPVVRAGESVKRGQPVARPAQGQLGATIHASIDGRVRSIDPESIWLERQR
jgi:Na+-translocating ferredoxin:NAD+ oxidoreductase RnfC subunit